MTSTGRVGQNVMRAAAAPVTTARAFHAATACTLVAKSSTSSRGTYVPGSSRTTRPAAKALVSARCWALVSAGRHSTGPAVARSVSIFTPRQSTETCRSVRESRTCGEVPRLWMDRFTARESSYRYHQRDQLPVYGVQIRWRYRYDDSESRLSLIHISEPTR